MRLAALSLLTGIPLKLKETIHNLNIIGLKSAQEADKLREVTS